VVNLDWIGPLRSLFAVTFLVFGISMLSCMIFPYLLVILKGHTHILGPFSVHLTFHQVKLSHF
jgi:hypothetical protein